MILAIMIAVGVMMFAAKPIGDFVDTHPTLKILALAFFNFSGRKFNCRKLRYSYSERLHLLCYGLLCSGGNAQHQDAKITWTLII